MSCAENSRISLLPVDAYKQSRPVSSANKHGANVFILEEIPSTGCPKSSAPPHPSTRLPEPKQWRRVSEVKGSARHPPRSRRLEHRTVPLIRGKQFSGVLAFVWTRPSQCHWLRLRLKLQTSSLQLRESSWGLGSGVWGQPVLSSGRRPAWVLRRGSG